MNKTWQLVLGVAVVAIAFGLFVRFIYQPRAEEATATTRMDQRLRASARYYDEPLGFVPDFEFDAHTGERFSKDELNNKVFVADFFFTQCDAACPMMSSNMSRVQKAFATEEDFKIVSFSLDPAKDDIQALARYASAFEAIDGSWYFLRGERDEIYDLGMKGFMQAMVWNEGVVDHSEKFILVDRNGGIRGFYQGTDTKEVGQLINDVRYLLRKEERMQREQASTN